MKISKWVDMGQEVDVEIGVDDIRAALGEALARVTDDRTVWGGEGPNRNDVAHALGAVGNFLRAFTDEHISLLSDSQRTIVAKFLSEQAERFKLKVVQP